VALDLVTIVEQTNATIQDVATVSMRLAAIFDLHWLELQIIALPNHDRWHTSAKANLQTTLQNCLANLCRTVLTTTDVNLNLTARLESWHIQNQVFIDRYVRLLTELKAHTNPDIAMLAVTLQTLQSLVP